MLLRLALAAVRQVSTTPAQEMIDLRCTIIELECNRILPSDLHRQAVFRAIPTLMDRIVLGSAV